MPLMTKICQACGLPFQTTSTQKLFCNRGHALPCPVCGQYVFKWDNDFTRKPICCSTECTVTLRKSNLPIRKCPVCGEMFRAPSGVTLMCDKEHHISCSICGKDMILTRRMWQDKIDTCSKECLKEKTRRFYQEKYGVDHPMQSSIVQAHHRAAMKAKYGVEHALQDPAILENAFQTNLERFGTKFACNREECKSKSEFAKSKVNDRFAEMLSNLGLTIERELMLDSRLFDISIVNQHILLEIDPTYTHNSLANHWNEPVDPNYQRMKSDIAIQNGYRCIHVFDWDSTEKVLDLIRPKQRVGARNCAIKEVDTAECNQFLNAYHLQGSLYKQTYRIGLYYNDELVQIMTFGEPRYDKKFSAELLRLCTKRGIAISGGASKLFKHAIQENPQWRTIVSYCDLAKFDGEVYVKLGMHLKRTTPPQAVWSKGTDKITSMLLRQRGYDQLFGTNYGKGTSNEELMIQNGWLPVYDCGQAVYEWRRT